MYCYISGLRTSGSNWNLNHYLKINISRIFLSHNMLQSFFLKDLRNLDTSSKAWMPRSRDERLSKTIKYFLRLQTVSRCNGVDEDFTNTMEGNLDKKSHFMIFWNFKTRIENFKTSYGSDKQILCWSSGARADTSAKNNLKEILWKHSIQSLKTADSVLMSLFMRDNDRCDIPHAA